MRQLQKIPTLNEDGSTQTAVLLITGAFALAVAGYLLFGQKPIQQTEENRSRAQSALETAGFGDIGEKIYGKDTK